MKFFTPGEPVAVSETFGAAVLTMSAAFPNPFRSSSAVVFLLAADQRVRVDVFDIAGRLVRRLLDGPLPAGEHQVAWDGLGAGGRSTANGVYFYRLQAGDEQVVRRVVRLE